MCGRFSLKTLPPELARTFELPEENLPVIRYGRFNIAPSQQVVTIRDTGSGKEFVTLKWGLIPSWTKEPRSGGGLINARAETIAEKPSFRSSLAERRCIILADGFYEWEKKDGKTQPYYFCLKTGAPFGFAGLFDSWKSPDGEVTETCAIITVAANLTVGRIHNRMPVIFSNPTQWNAWLDRSNKDTATLSTLLKPLPDEELISYPVTTIVNSPQRDTAECIVPLEKCAG